MTKIEIRKLKIITRRYLSGDYRLKASQVIVEKLFETKEFQGAKIVHIYKATEYEVRTQEIINKCFELGKKVIVPVTSLDFNNTRHYEIFPNTFFELDKNGIAFPIENFEKFDLKEMTAEDLFVIPLVAFDNKNNRIGYGKGCYDRFLFDAVGYKLGLAFVCQLVNKIVSEEFDVQLDRVLVDEL